MLLGWLDEQGVGADANLTRWGCGVKLELVYAASPCADSKLTRVFNHLLKN